MFWPFTVWINCSSDLKIFAHSRPSAFSFKSFSRLLEQFFLTVVQNNFVKNFGNKIPLVGPNLKKFFYVLIKKPYLSSDLREKKLGLTDVMQLLHCYIDDLNQHAVVFSKEVQIVYRLFLVNCYLLHVPRLPYQPPSSGGGWVIDFIWFELAWQ